MQYLPLNEYVWKKKGSPKTPVHDQQQSCWQKYREGNHSDNGSDKESPDGQLQTTHGHSFGSKI